jgi:hypothetical protein
MQRQPLHDLVDGVPRPVDGQPDQRQVVGGDGADGGPVGLVVAGLEHLLDVDGDREAAADGERADPAQGGRVGRVDQHRLAEHRQVGVA